MNLKKLYVKNYLCEIIVKNRKYFFHHLFDIGPESFFTPIDEANHTKRKIFAKQIEDKKIILEYVEEEY